MLRFESVHLRHFALYEDLQLEFSRDVQRPLTFIRGENECGKTTLLRALTWILFGDGAVPTGEDDFDPIRPIYATVEDTVTTYGQLVLEHLDDGGDVINRWRITRRTDTSIDNGEVRRKPSGPLPATVERFVDAGWIEEPAGLEKLQNTFFRNEMKEFYFIDADKADRYVGGSEGRHDDSLMKATTTQAMRSLLGINVLRKLMTRVEQTGRHFQKQAAKKAGDKDASQIAEEIEEAASQRDRLNDEIKQKADKLAGLETRLEAARTSQDQEHGQNQEFRQLTARIDKLSADVNRIRGEVSAGLSAAVDHLHDPSVYLAMAAPALADVHARLGGLEKAGVLPPSEVALLPRILEGDSCICGEPLTAGRREKIHERYDESSRFYNEASALDRVRLSVDEYDRRRRNFRDGSFWTDAVEDALAATEEQRAQQHALEHDLEVLEERRKAIPELGDSYAAEVSMLSIQVERAQRELDDLERNRDAAKSKHESATKRYAALDANLRRARLEHRAQQVAADIHRALAMALHAIERERVDEIGAAMNEAFHMIADDRLEDDQGVGLTSEVGVRIVSGSETEQGVEYEIYAKDQRGADKPLVLLNGANRRATAVAFVLALSQVSRQRPPFVADSLFHATSGNVRRNLLRYVLDTSAQPILFGTRSDVSDTEADLRTGILDRVHKSYTLTNVHQGALVNGVAAMLRTRSAVAVCTCMVSQICPACERRGDRERDYERVEQPTLLT